MAAFGSNLINDIIHVTSSDPVTGTSGDDTIYGWDGGRSEIHGGGGNDTLIGRGNSKLYGDAGDDIIDQRGGTGLLLFSYGGSGRDTIYGGDGYDFIWLGDTYDENTQPEFADGGGGDDEIYNFPAAGVYNPANIYGGDGNDYIVSAAAGHQFLSGGAGNDTVQTYNSIEAEIWLGEGSDTLAVAIMQAGDPAYIFAVNDFVAGVDRLEIDYSRIIYDFDARIDPFLAGQLRLMQYDGYSELQYNPDSPYETDRFFTLVKFVGTLASSFSAIDFFGYAPFNLSYSRFYGTTQNDILGGTSGNDVINGAWGIDTMSGGVGDDIYFVDNIGDRVVELANSGLDVVYAYVSYSIYSTYVENAVLSSTGNFNLTGNSLNNVLTGNSGNNMLSGLGGNDALNGGSGNDTMSGGLGHDTYYVDAVGDKVTEANGQGVDTVMSSVTYSVATQFVEVLTLTGTANINATGNTLNNTLTGNSGNNVLDGGASADTMTGGLGNDTYYVDNIGDKTVEANGGGTDTVISSVSYSVATSFVEAVTLTGTANFNLTGNTLNNTLTGNAGNNVLDGGAGADTMTGGLGDDTYWVDNIGDKVVEANGGGTDTIMSSVSYSVATQFVETLVLRGTTHINAIGNTLNNTLTGNAGNNVLSGGAGIDTITGGAGNDTLTGGSQADVFIFGLGSGVDRITDFLASQGDTINVHAYNAQMTAVIAQSGADTTIDLGGGNIITIANTTATNAAFLSHIVW